MRHSTFALISFRAISTSWVAIGNATIEVSAAARAARAATEDSPADAAAFVAYAADADAVVNAADAVDYAATDAYYAAAEDVIDADDAAADDAADDAHAAVWRAISVDATALETGQSAVALAVSPLWPSDVPQWADSPWQRMKNKLLTDPEEQWWVWTEWYEARLKGEPFNPDLELARVLIPDETWKQGPKVVNAEIARLIKQHKPPLPPLPVIPEERPAPVHFIFTDKLHRAPPPAPMARDQGAAESAWRGLRALVDDLVGHTGSNHPVPGLKRYSDALGETFAQLDLICCGVLGDALKRYGDLAGQELLPAQAADLLALMAHHGLFMSQFPQWSAYLAGVKEPFGSKEAVTKAVNDAVQALEVIKRDYSHLIAKDALGPLDDLGAAALEGGGEEEQRAFLRSERSALRAYAENALEAIAKGHYKGLEKVGEKGTVALIAGVGTSLVALATGIPSEFGWLKAIVDYVLLFLS
ncbi:MAG: hypothetical protein A2516_08275 [Alphaproteobacteria bacterium RIFOXYD12_FULL_60_8]|nr:MAG: hypothetical protein A2516_08275 [Alphaproteobacteria bacterium RIFOXYD12_FULL_60_8]